MKGFVLGLIVAALAFAGVLAWNSGQILRAASASAGNIAGLLVRGDVSRADPVLDLHASFKAPWLLAMLSNAVVFCLGWVCAPCKEDRPHS